MRKYLLATHDHESFMCHTTDFLIKFKQQTKKQLDPFTTSLLLDMCFLTGTIMDYHNVSQGKTSIPGVDDGEECELMDVREIRQKKLFI